MSSFFMLLQQPPVKLAIVGGGCSVATEPTAELSYFFNLTQVSGLGSNCKQFMIYYESGSTLSQT